MLVVGGGVLPSTLSTPKSVCVSSFEVGPRSEVAGMGRAEVWGVVEMKRDVARGWRAQMRVGRVRDVEGEVEAERRTRRSCGLGALILGMKPVV